MQLSNSFLLVQCQRRPFRNSHVVSGILAIYMLCPVKRYCLYSNANSPIGRIRLWHCSSSSIQHGYVRSCVSPFMDYFVIPFSFVLYRFLITQQNVLFTYYTLLTYFTLFNYDLICKDLTRPEQMLVFLKIYELWWLRSLWCM